MDILANIWQYKPILIAVLVVALLAAIFGIAKKHPVITVICLIVLCCGTGVLVSAWNVAKSKASTAISAVESKAEEEGIYDKDRASDIFRPVEDFFRDLVH